MTLLPHVCSLPSCCLLRKLFSQLSVRPLISSSYRPISGPISHSSIFLLRLLRCHKTASFKSWTTGSGKQQTNYREPWKVGLVAWKVSKRYGVSDRGFENGWLLYQS